MGSGASCCCSKNAVGVVPPVQASGGSVHASIAARAASKLWGKSFTEQNAGDAQQEISSSAVKVAVMVRPLLEFEQQGGSTSVVQVQPPNKALVNKAGGEPEEFVYDRVYRADTSAANSALYSELVTRVLQRFFQGFNGTIIAYGQTGSGKTYTMGTAASYSHGQAIIPTVMSKVFKHVADSRAKYESKLKVSFVEIYNESIQDLLVAPSPLSPQRSGVLGIPISPASSLAPTGGSGTWAAGLGGGDGGIALREGPGGEIILDGVTEVEVSSPQEVVALLATGNKHRATASHKLNAESSRSHAIVLLSMDQQVRPSAASSLPKSAHVIRGKLRLVDLAGSERAKETGTTGARFTEGIHINKGLLELGNVINALTEGSARRHIPYRNSKLTRLLQDSLGGNSETLFIACVSPAEINTDHTISTLRYASRAMRITNSLQQNKLTLQEELAMLRALVQQLQAENATLKQQLAGDQRHSIA